MSYHNLLLNNRYYPKAELLKLCVEKIHATDSAEWEINLYRFIQQWLNDSATLMVKTSGTTGEVKEITITKQAMIQSAQMTGRYFQLQPQQTALLCLPTTHIAGQMMVVRAFVLGLNLLAIQPNAISLNNLNQPIDFAAMLPLQLHNLLFADSASLLKLNQIKTLLLGGGTVSEAICQALQALKMQVYQSYAMTETLSHIALRRLHPQPEPYYQTLEGVEIEQDSRGCLVIHAPSLAVDNLVTNDLVKLHSDNQFELLGRFDNLINSGGIKINPEQLEIKLAAMIPTRRFFISSVDDDRLGQKLILLIEGCSFSTTELESLETQIKMNLDRYQRPKAIYFVEQFVQTPTGKVQRQITCHKLDLPGFKNLEGL